MEQETTQASNKENSENNDALNNDQHVETATETNTTEPEIIIEEPKQLSTEEIIAQQQHKIDELNDKYLRLYAEYDNFKRRSLKERQDYIATAGKELFVVMVSLLDDFDRAQKAIQTATDLEAVKEGINLIHNKVKATLQSKGLEEFTSIGQEFNSDIHEAITMIPAASDDLKNKVIDEVEKGYNLNGKMLRVAKVVVGS